MYPATSMASDAPTQILVDVLESTNVFQIMHLDVQCKGQNNVMYSTRGSHLDFQNLGIPEVFHLPIFLATSGNLLRQSER